MKVLFLDIDGVLNSTEYSKKVVRRSLVADPITIDPDAVKRLQGFLEKYDDLVIVISSTWRKALAIEELKEVLEEKGLDASRVIEYTPVIHGVIRGEEIKAWLRSQSLKSNFAVHAMAILDDDADMGSLLPYLVQTNLDVGLQDEDLLRLQETLAKDLRTVFPA